VKEDLRDLTDQELMDGIGRGDETAFLCVYRAHQAALFRFAWHMTGSREAAEEAVQEAFLTLIHQPERWQSDRGTIRAFLFGVTRNQCRRTWHEPEAEELDEQCGADSDLLGALEAGQRETAVREAIATMPEAHREVLVLCELQEMSYQEAALVLGVPVGTIRSRLNRAKTHLADRLRARLTPATAEAS
jgi:RNA polymerase sigma-70 factor (ECF subfamily)